MHRNGKRVAVLGLGLLLDGCYTAYYNKEYPVTEGNPGPLLTQAQQRWGELAAHSYSYTLRLGGDFGASVYRVRVQDGNCTAKLWVHHQRFRALGYFTDAERCDDLLIGKLMEAMTASATGGLAVSEIAIEPIYGFARQAWVTIQDPPDQDWGFAIWDFKLQAPHGR